MHNESLTAMEEYIPLESRSEAGTRVLEFGSLNINGSPRHLFGPDVTYVGVDLQEGPDVDIVGDAATVTVEPLESFDIVICTEVFEHTPVWKDIIHNAWRHLKEGGLFVCTAGGENRPPHSAVDGRYLEPYEYQEYNSVDWKEIWAVEGIEYYHNIGVEELLTALAETFKGLVDVRHHPRGDVYGSGVKLSNAVEGGRPSIVKLYPPGAWADLRKDGWEL